MERKKKWTVTMIFCFLLTWGSVMSIQSSYMPVPKAQETETGIMYMTGGVGSESRAIMDATADNYNLKVVVASTTGAFLADAMIVITDAAGKKIFKTATDGPWLLVKLPVGTYQVRAAIDNRWETRKVKLSERLKTIFFHWRP